MKLSDKDVIEFNVNFADCSYKKTRNIYKVKAQINDSVSPTVEILAYYKTKKSKGKECCYVWQEKDKLRLKSSYEEFIVSGLTYAIDTLKQRLVEKEIKK